jgi:glutamate racemase
MDRATSQSFPIGVFDSGIGGLTVLAELRRRLPSEDFIYLGDVARLPYGTKSSAVVSRYAQLCLQFLLAQRVKAVVIACNTASAMALDGLRRGSPVPVLGVVAPGVSAGVAASAGRRVLVLATESTVGSQSYPREFFLQSPQLEVEQVACPLLVPLAEEGWHEHPVTESVISHYLARARPGFGTVVLGCTHYPLLEASFRRVLGPEVRLVHGATRLAEELARELSLAGLCRPPGLPGSTRFLATDRIATGLPIARALFPGPICFETVDL